jgi:hypothetical protein
MQKPAGYDGAEAKTGTGFENPPAGGYTLKIISAVETRTKTNNEPMLVLEMDIIAGPFKNYYSDLSKRLNKEWYLTHRRVINEKNTGYLKGDIQSIEKSNNGFKYDFNEHALIGRYVGAVLREEEYEKRDGTVGVKLSVGYLCSLDTIKDKSFKLLPLKPLKKDASFNGGYASSDNAPPHSDDDSLPF